MTPGARVAAAIAVLERIDAGVPAEKALLHWARSARYAGSKDRAAIRDRVFGVIRRSRSAAVLGGGTSARARMIGSLRDDGADLDGLFSGQGHAPSALTPEEQASGARPHGADALDVPDWALPLLTAALGDDTQAVLQKFRHRAPLHLRVHSGRMSRQDAIKALAQDGIIAVEHPLSETALEVTEGARAVRQTPLYKTGSIEIQDAASQAVADRVPIGETVLDYCAGGGGKSLALAARAVSQYFAHDADPGRMSDLPERARRAKADIQILTSGDFASGRRFETVLADVPCSGSGAWRRQPEAKWRLTEARLQELTSIQARILQTCAGLTDEGGHLAYATCSLFREENEQVVEHFLTSNSTWICVKSCRISPIEGADGLFLAVFTRKG